MSIEGPPSLYKPKKYCDILGFPTNYTDRNTGLNYYDQWVQNYIKRISRPNI